MPIKNAFYAQSGGVTAVINTTACGVIEAARNYPQQIAKVLAGRNGILGALNHDLIDTSLESADAIAALRYTPGGAFGSCRYKLKSLKENRTDYEKLIEVFAQYNIGYFFYNGGGDSQDTALKVSQLAAELNYPIQCIGIPKTIDNDLPVTDNCPGFGSVAKYIAISTQEAALDVASMAATSTKVFVLEVMGRHTGWIAAASCLAARNDGDAPHIILLPEVAFQIDKFLQRVQQVVQQHGYCVIVVSEGIRTPDGQFLSDAGMQDAFGHKQLGGVAPIIAQLVKDKLGFKYHWAVADYLQRSARHIAAKIDVEQAYAVGKAAVDFAIAGKNAVMPIIVRESDHPYRWSISEIALAEVANQEKCLPPHFISKDGFQVTEACKTYLSPLIQGEDYPPYSHGMPNYVKLKNFAAQS